MAGNSKNALLPYHIVSAISMGADITSNATNIQFYDNVAIQLIFSGTPTGTFEIQGSLDYAQAGTGVNLVILNAGTWTPITLSPLPVTTGVAGDILIDMTQLSFPWIRIKYVRASGTGALDAYISGKAV